MKTSESTSPMANVAAPAGALRQADVVTWFGIGTDNRGLEARDNPPLERGCTVVVCTYKRAESLQRFLASLAVQALQPDGLIIVDASPDDHTERTFRQFTESSPRDLASYSLYVRVTGQLRGLTRQRNFALRLVSTDLVAFFDDDVVLQVDCLREMEATHRRLGEQAVGVAAYIMNEAGTPNTLWRLRRLLGIVPHLQPGRYVRSGMSTSWGYLSPTEETVEGDWLGGGCTMWKTAPARAVGFNEREFHGYGQGEDLEFSLRMRRRGKLLLAGSARLDHLHDGGGRPNHFKLGYMAIYNRYYIHRHGLAQRTWRDVAWFTYAWTLDSLLLARHFAFPGRWLSTLQQLGGRLSATYDIVRGL